NCARLAASDREVSPGIFLAGSEHSFETVVRTPLQEPSQQRFRLISGYSGWGPQQLEGEIARGDWHLLSADSSLILEDNPYGIWEVCRRRLRRLHRLLNTEVRNPEWN
ncbi:MAG: YqgE/AlgH family protein, partial [Planctomycetaceae bacterium]